MYTDGQDLWDKTNNIMPNGAGLFSYYSSYQPAIIVPHPGDTNNYFVFTVDAFLEGSPYQRGLHWHEVDMALNGGLGDVISKNNLLTSYTQERIAAVRNASSTGYWVVVLKASTGMASGNEFYAYEVTAAGVNPTPVISTTGPMILSDSRGLYISPQGNTLVLSEPFCIYDFNNTSGVVSHRWTASTSTNLRAFEFSPDGNFLYGCGGRFATPLYQFDLTAPNVNDFNSSNTQITTEDVSDVRLGPDCRIYVMPPGNIATPSNTIHVINQPNRPGLSCDFKKNSSTYTSGGSASSFPIFCASFFETPCNNLDYTMSAVDAGCNKDGSITLTIIDGKPPYSFLWSTGDTTQNLTNIGGGTYTVTITDNSGCPVTDSIVVNQPQTISIDNAFITNPTTCISSDGAINLTTSVAGLGTKINILTEGFETDGEATRYTLNPTGANGATSFFKRGDDAGINFSTPPTGEEGNFYFGARRTGFGGVPADVDLTFNSLNISGYTNIEACVSLALGANNMNSSTANYVTIEYNIDGGGWNTLMTFRKPAGFPANGLSEDTNNDGIGDGTALSTAFQDFCYSIPSTGNNIEIRVSANASGSSLTQIGFDHIRLNAVPPFTYSYLWSTGDTTEDITGLAEGTYWIQITGSGGGCVVTDTFEVTSPCALKASFIPQSTSICTGDCITFTDNSTGTNLNTWNWTFNGGTPASASDQDPGSICFNTPGTYNITLEVTDDTGTDDTIAGMTSSASDTANFNYSKPSYCQDDSDPTPNITGTTGGIFTSSAGLIINPSTGVIDLSASTTGTYGILYTTPDANCPDTLTIFVTIEANEVATFSYDSLSYCKNETYPTPNITGSLGGSFSSTTGLAINVNTGTIDLSASTPGTYGVLYTTSSTNCGDTLTVSVNIIAADTASFNYPNNSFCINDTNPTPIITGTTGGVFSINNGGSINPSTGEIDLLSSGAGDYNITYSFSGPCPEDSTITISITPQMNAAITPIGPFCETDDPVSLVSIDAGGTWSGFGVTSSSFSPNAAGIGTHKITYNVGIGNCLDTDSINVIVSSNPSITLTVQDDNCFDEKGSITSSVSGGTLPFDYNWDSGESSADISELPAGTYTLIVTDSMGCTSTSVATVMDVLNNCEFHIFVPNIFSPNGDGNNDLFLVRGKGIKSLNLIIYSRWGEKVFETTDPEIGWDGRFKGQEMNTAVFVYYVKATMITNEVIEQKGNVTLVK